ncbi:hypothetical protein ABL78_4794 [Leptomonas seymouri]|uniref:EF-hand domain-containing protein n=1 Tax=Leptomonas seymouri TaxID=5684 RepID=A0A0N0P577_LEPSE|nr:hypothetical protein ABL78_4794 [Leptomonas seymouri]|eukprot:KPI86139.1 hypothetical protein ABL78_4794 [Leptomonas seymouri]
MTSPTPAETSVANAAPPSPVLVGFQTKRAAGVSAMPPSTAAITPERMAYLEATLAKLPELDLSEMARVKTCFASVLGEGRENIVSGLELRVVLGDLGLYPSEEELKLVLRAYRDRVNLVGLARYLQLYKKEFWLNQVAARSTAQQQPRRSINAPMTGTQSSKKQLAGAHTSTTGAAAVAGSFPHTYTAFSGSSAPPGGADDDTLRAFVALGGEEDGSGEISAATLRDAVRGFGLTIDIDAMIRNVDVHHSGMLDYVDFCALWAAPAEGSTTDSMGNALRQASADVEHRESVGGHGVSPFSPDGISRRLLSVLLTPSHRSSVATDALRRRSLAQSGGYDAWTPQAVSPHFGAAAGGAGGAAGGGGGGGGGGRPPAHGDRSEGTGNGANTAVARAPVLSAALPAPISEDEHALLMRMFLFPEHFESSASASPVATSDMAGRRQGARFTLPPRTAQATTLGFAGAAGGGQLPVNGGSTAAGAQSGARHTTLALRNHQAQRLSHAGGGGRARSQSKRTGSNTHGRRGNNNGNGGNGSGEGDDGGDLAADFFSPKNQNVYRPPSPMLLSMRNSTAYRNRVKRLEEQKRAARGLGGSGGTTHHQQQSGLHAATASRDGGAGGYGYGYGADGENASRPSKLSTW